MSCAAVRGSPISDFGALTDAERRYPRRNRTAAAWIWLLGAVVYLVCEAIAAARYPGYSYVENFISDLGVFPVMTYGAFMLHGSLFLVGAVVATRSVPALGSLGWGFIFAAAANAVGNIVVGAFRSGSHWHVLGAGLAIVGGNVAAILAGFVSGRLGASPAYRRASVAVGVVGLGCLVALILDGSRSIPVGVVERGSVYSITVWEIMTAAVILTGRGRCSRR